MLGNLQFAVGTWDNTGQAVKAEYRVFSKPCKDSWKWAGILERALISAEDWTLLRI